MPKLDLKQRFTTVRFTQGEIQGFVDYAKAILAKKRGEAPLHERIMAEMGEGAVDFFLEVKDKPRVWSRGPFHFDFTNRKGKIKLEIKTRKMYGPRLDDLDVRLDYREYEAAVEATHLVPVVFNEFSNGADVVSPGVFELDAFIAGTEKNKRSMPVDTRLKFPCFRTTWGRVFKDPNTYGFKPWEDFLKTW